MLSLGDATARGRDNNLNLIRMIAALAVLVSHAWPMVYGAQVAQPLHALTGQPLGAHAVTVFFVLSGVLIAASVFRHEDLSPRSGPARVGQETGWQETGGQGPLGRGPGGRAAGRLSPGKLKLGRPQQDLVQQDLVQQDWVQQDWAQQDWPQKNRPQTPRQQPGVWPLQRRFWIARLTRLWPGLVMANLVLVFGLGPLTTELGLGAYFTAPQTWAFLFGNSLALRPVFPLPGVFETNPHPTVHGSIWTLRFELACWGGLALLAASGLLRRRGLLLGLCLIGYPLAWLMAERLALPWGLRWLLALSYPFMLGTLAWLWRDKIPLSALGVAGLGGLAWLAGASFLGPALQTLAIGYGVLWLAYVPAGWLRAYNRLGDYSYGLYIYAFPVQGLVVWLFGPGTPLSHCLLALGPTLLCAVLSWHLIERPALDWGRKLGGLGPPNPQHTLAASL